MTGWIIGALVAAAAAQGYGPTSTENQERASTPGSEVEKSSHHLSKEEAEARLKNCGARKFQATATARIDGKPRRTKLLLCAADSETNEQWIAQLEKAVTEVETSAELNEEMRDQLLKDLHREIGKLRAGS